MNFIRLLLLTLLAVAALLGGFLVAAVIAAGAAATWLIRRFWLKSGAMQLPSRATAPSPSPEASRSEVIDIAATEVTTTSHRP